MADHALFMGWNQPARGREKEAAAVFQKGMEYYGTLQAEGKIESFEAVILARHGGDMNGYIILRGDTDKLHALRSDDTFIDLVLECGHCVDGFGVVDAYINEGLMDVMGRWTKLATA